MHLQYHSSAGQQTSLKNIPSTEFNNSADMNHGKNIYHLHRLT